MFTITKQTRDDKEYVILENKNIKSKAEFCLNEGGRIQNLTLEDRPIIIEQPNFNYKDSYASSFLFPFVGRLKKGEFNFCNKVLQFDKNDNNIHALHGIVYNKKFALFKPEENIYFAKTTLFYTENKPVESFPFKYLISITYTLFCDKINIEVVIKNLDEKAFPFTLGWHPYFVYGDSSKVELKFTPKKQIIYDKTMVTESLKDFKLDKPLILNNKFLDDGYELATNEVDLVTESYSLKISSDTPKNFLQLYTPHNIPIIAIEPMTGVSNSLNNNIGLQLLEPNMTYALNWNVKLT